MDRREFLIGAGALTAAATVSVPAHGSDLILNLRKSGKKGLSILQGLTTETTTQLSVDVGADIKAVYLLEDMATGRKVQPLSVRPNTYGNSDVRVDKIKFTDLELNHRYKLTVTDTEKRVVLDERFLSTVDLNKPNARIAVMSCMNDGKSAVDDIWPSAEASDIDYFFFIGDNVYGDLWILYGPNYLWKRYIESRENIPFYHWKNLKPVIAVWDDHDFGKNNAGGEYKYKDHSYAFFHTFFAQEAEGEALMRGYGISTYFQAFGQNFVFFDNRFYRDIPNSHGHKGFLGVEQIDWISQAVKARGEKPTWILQGSPTFGRTEKGSSYQASAPDEFSYFLRKVRGWNSPLLFLGGDLHYSEVSQTSQDILGFKSYELISSCMHSNTKKAFYDNPNKQVGGYLKENFLVLTKNGRQTDALWNVTCVGKDKKMPFEAPIAIG